MGAAAIIGAAALGAGINASSDLLVNYLNHRWSRNEWNMQNEYDLPSNQMQRMMDAGMNPNLAMQNVSNGTNPINIGGLSLGSMGNFNPADIMLRKELQDAEIANKNEETRGNRIKNDVDAETSGYTIEERKQIAEGLGLENKMKKENYDILVATKQEQIQTIIANRKLVEEKVNETLKNIDKLQSEIDVNEKQLDVMDANIELTEEKTKTEKTVQGKNIADARATTADAVWQEFKNGIAKEIGVDPDSPLINQFTVLLKQGKKDQAFELLDNAKTFQEDFSKAASEGTTKGSKGYSGLVGSLLGVAERIGLYDSGKNYLWNTTKDGKDISRTGVSYADYRAGIRQFKNIAYQMIDDRNMTEFQKKQLKSNVDKYLNEHQSRRMYQQWLDGNFDFDFNEMINVKSAK